MTFKTKYIKLFIITTVILLLGMLILQNKWTIYRYLLTSFLNLPEPIKAHMYLLSGKRNFSNVQNDYNVKFLPETQFLKIDFYKKKIETERDMRLRYGAYLEEYGDYTYYITKKGKFYKILKSSIENKKQNLELSILDSNLDEIPNFFEVLDTLVVDNKIYITTVNKYKINCSFLNIYSSEMKDDLNFSIFKKFEECGVTDIRGGRLQNFTFNNKKGLLISTGDFYIDNVDNRPQDQNSIWGKILFVDFKKKEHIVFSKGHRNPQGLFVKGNDIFSTEHGPKGGDEINKIIFNGNYGWPKASYGISYHNKRKYLKSHQKNGFEEPIYAFVPSIGISEIIILPNSFHEKWIDNAIVTTLFDRSIYRMKFKSSEFNEILYLEKIFIGERIRDIKYLKDDNLIILALEDTGAIGVLKPLKN